MFESFEYYLQMKMKRLLLRPFHYWRAYQMGIIDRDGNKLREPDSETEKTVYNVFDDLIRKIKQLFMKYVPNKGLVRHKIYKEFMTDGPIKALDESVHFSRRNIVVTEETQASVDTFVINWLRERGY